MDYSASRPLADFDLRALFEALDAQRQARGLSWQQVACQVGRRSNSKQAGIAVSTITGVRTRRVVEGDGVLQMLLWLERTPESFVPAYPQPDAEVARLQRPDRDQVLRWDTRALHAALEARRLERGLTWKQVAREIGGFAPSSLARLAQGGRVGVPPVMRIVCWLERPAASFTHTTPV